MLVILRQYLVVAITTSTVPFAVIAEPFIVVFVA